MLNICVFRFLDDACKYAVNKGRRCSLDLTRGKESNSFSPSLGAMMLQIILQVSVAVSMHLLFSIGEADSGSLNWWDSSGGLSFPARFDKFSIAWLNLATIESASFSSSTSLLLRQVLEHPGDHRETFSVASEVNDKLTRRLRPFKWSLNEAVACLST